MQNRSRRVSLARRCAAALLLTVVATGCGGSEDAATGTTAQDEGSQTVELVDPARGESLVADGAMLIDVRTPAEYEEGHIEGAVLASLESGEFEARLEDLDVGMSYVLYCRTGNRSATAASLMAERDFERVYDMGGIVEWENSGRPVVAG
ncbi:MAG: rhodanese-like domain-containing protein [Actinomycetota bacterium]|nr:rhodanese-like domain-containing protein [Actinomycetota bacterium]